MIMDINDLLKDEKGNSFIDMNNHSDWIKFFFIFSRFEYALKRSRYTKGDEKSVEANWTKFGNDVKEVFHKTSCPELTEAISYLKENPPKKQVLKNNTLDWDCPEEKQDIQRLIDAVKRVRNNLFHGGKYPLPAEPVTDPSRNRELIKHSITVLKYLLYSSDKVKNHYGEPLE